MRLTRISGGPTLILIFVRSVLLFIPSMKILGELLKVARCHFLSVV
jgi:hypothetical protein